MRRSRYEVPRPELMGEDLSGEVVMPTEKREKEFKGNVEQLEKGKSDFEKELAVLESLPGTVTTEELAERYPVYADERTEEEKQEDRAEAKTLLQKIRNHPLTKPVFNLLTFARLGMSLETVQVEHDTEVAIDENPIELSASDLEMLEDEGVAQEFENLVLEELKEGERLFTEAEGRFGKENEWTNDKLVQYTEAPVDVRFLMLHEDDPQIIEAYTNPDKRLDNYRALTNIMYREFAHSRLMIDFTEETVMLATDQLAEMEDRSQAVESYTQFTKDLMDVAGARHVFELSSSLMTELSPDDPLYQTIEGSGFATALGELLTESKDNHAVFDQVWGLVKVYRSVNGTEILLDTFPANGGPVTGGEYGAVGTHEAVRTPDGNFTLHSELDRKTSWSWQSAWMADRAELRWANEEQTAVEYKDNNGQWRMATGEDAYFLGQQPFKNSKVNPLYKAATRVGDGEEFRPEPFTIEQFLDENGELRKTWGENAFGPLTIYVSEVGKSKRETFMFHSSPVDEAPGVFLEWSHGCPHMKPHDLEMMAGYLAKGSEIRISSVLGDFESTEELFARHDVADAEMDTGEPDTGIPESNL